MKISDIKSKPMIMGILNITPDSFSDGGKYYTLKDAMKRVEEMLSEGAEIIDVGGESTRPGSDRVSLEEELRRVIPLIRNIKQNFDLPVSCDTSKWEVAREALNSGADMLNNVTGFTDPRMRQVAKDFSSMICIMHMRGTPRTMQDNPVYNDVVADIKSFLYQQSMICEEEGILHNNIVVDPGIGFGKRLEDNLKIIANIKEFAEDYPVMLGASRKSFIENALGVDSKPSERITGSLAVAGYAALEGVSILRVHDVKETKQITEITNLIKEKKSERNSVYS